MRTFIALLSLLAVLAIAAGCARKEASNTTTPPSSATNEPTASAPPPSAEHAPEQGEQVSTEGSAKDIMARVDHEESELGQVISNAQLKVVHQKAFAIRDLVAAAADKATLSETGKAQLNTHVEKVKTLASQLDEAGDAGDLSKTKAEYADLRAELQAIRQLLGTHQ